MSRSAHLPCGNNRLCFSAESESTKPTRQQQNNARYKHKNKIRTHHPHDEKCIERITWIIPNGHCSLFGVLALQHYIRLFPRREYSCSEGSHTKESDIFRTELSVFHFVVVPNLRPVPCFAHDFLVGHIGPRYCSLCCRPRDGTHGLPADDDCRGYEYPSLEKTEVF